MGRGTRRIRGTIPGLEEAAWRLRQNLTPAEARLWRSLRNRQLEGLRFRCQHPVGRFILDFYCPSQKLAIEVDGSVHDEQVEYDAVRTKQLEAYGYRVLRFTNEAVMGDLDGVLEEIRRAVL